MTFQQLEYFKVLAKYESFSEAARALNISQSALSQIIKKLENELHYTLFDRSGHSAQLNQNGVRFLECVNSIFALIENSKRESCASDEGYYELWLGMLTPNSEVVRLCTQYMEQKNDVAIRVLSDRYLNKPSEKERADLLVGSHDLRPEGFSSRPLFDLRDYAVFPQSFLHPAPKTISLTAMQSMPLALCSPLDGAQPQIIKRFIEEGHAPNVRFIADSPIDVLSAMRTGQYLTVCPSSDVDLYLSVSPDLVAVPIESPRPESPQNGQLYISWNENRLNARARGLLEFLLERFEAPDFGQPLS